MKENLPPPADTKVAMGHPAAGEAAGEGLGIAHEHDRHFGTEPDQMLGEAGVEDLRPADASVPENEGEANRLPSRGIHLGLPRGYGGMSSIENPVKAAGRQSTLAFLIIGVQKGGTTSLFEYLRKHPEIHMPVEKDIAFFNRDANFRRGREWYLNTVLRDAPPGTLSGEASTYYMSGTPFGDLPQNERRQPKLEPGEREGLEEVVPRRIREYLPEARLICVLRDPVERAFSHHRMMVLERAERRSFDEAIDQLLAPAELEKARVAPTRTNNYIVNGEYGRVLEGYLSVFPREQLAVVFSDDLSQQPEETLTELFEFIGVDSSFMPENAGTRYREAADEERIPGFNLYNLQMRVAGNERAKTLWHSMPDPVRSRIDRAFTVMSYRVQMWNAKRGASGEEMSAASRDRLRAHFRGDGEKLAALVGEEVPWLAKWGGA